MRQRPRLQNLSQYFTAFKNLVAVSSRVGYLDCPTYLECAALFRIRVTFACVAALL